MELNGKVSNFEKIKLYKIAPPVIRVVLHHTERFVESFNNSTVCANLIKAFMNT